MGISQQETYNDVRKKYHQPSFAYGSLTTGGNTLGMLNRIGTSLKSNNEKSAREDLEILYISLMVDLMNDYSKMKDTQTQYIIRHGKHMRELFDVNTYQEFSDHRVFENVYFDSDVLVQLWKFYEENPTR